MSSQLFFSYKFNDTVFGDSQTLKIVLRIFMDFDLMNKFFIPHEVKKSLYGMDNSHNNYCLGCL